MGAWFPFRFTKPLPSKEAEIGETLGYVVQIEHIRFYAPGQEKESARDYRVTMLFRREPEGWRIIHRQADSQMMKQAPQTSPPS